MIFVFGSNLAGRHGKGAAAYARKHFAAEYGVGEGRTGRAYALPTKDAELRTLPFNVIREKFLEFADHADFAREEVFLLTPFGCGLAGHDAKDIARMVKSANLTPNVALSVSWLDHLA